MPAPQRTSHLRLTVLVLTALLLAVTACTPAPALDGRLLLISDQNGSQSIFEYKDGMEAPQSLWTGIPYAWFLTSGFYIDPDFAISVDNKYAMPYGNPGVLNLTDGTFQKLTLAGVGQPGSKGIAGAFSPDDRYLAYSLTGVGGNSRSGLYLFDLGTGQTASLYESPCADYDLFGEVCGGTGRPFWIDKNTLVFNGYSGAMPDSVEKSSTVEAPSPNRTFVVKVDGTILQEISPVLGGAKIEYQLVSGPTLFIGSDSSDYQEDWKWLETADLVRGVIKANPISGFNIVPSPEGQFVIQRIDSQWHLTELRTGVDKQLKGEYMTKCLHAAWSLDGKYVTCSTASSDGYHVMMISLEKRTIREIKEAQGYFLLTWVP